MKSPTLIPSMPRSRIRRAVTCTIRSCVASLSACECPIFSVSKVGLGSGELRRVLPDKCLYRHWRSAGQFLDEGIGAGKNAVLVIDRNRQQMLREGVAKFCVAIQALFEQVEIDR